MARIKIGNIKGPQGPIGPTGPQGPRGETGPQGPLPPLTNNGLATVAGVSALDAAYGKTLTEKDAELQKQIDTTNSNLSGLEELIAKGRFFVTFNNAIDLDAMHTDNRLTFASGYGAYIIIRNASLVIGYTDKNGLYGGQLLLSNGKLQYRSKYNNGAFSVWVDK